MLIKPLARPPDAVIEVPGSKSITNRALLIAGLAAGRTTIRGALVADDSEAMVTAVHALGASVAVLGDALHVVGVGGVLPVKPVRIDARKAATVGRFLPAVLAAAKGPHVVDGDRQLRGRPIGPLLDALRELGAAVTGDALPVEISGPAEGGTVRMPGDVSSQFVSALLLAGPLYAAGIDIELTTPLVSRPYVDMTAAVMQSFGVPVASTNQKFSVGPGGYVAPGEYRIEPDASSASYFFAAAAMTGGRVRVEGLGSASLQGDLRFVDVLASMGADVTVGPDHVEVSGRASSGVDVELSAFSDMVPTLAVVAALAESPTTIRGVGFVRGKESDRIGAVVAELRRLGIGADERDDGLVITPGPVGAGAVETYGDHRMAMAFALLGLVGPGVDILGPECVDKTFPRYFTVLERLRG